MLLAHTTQLMTAEGVAQMSMRDNSNCGKPQLPMRKAGRAAAWHQQRFNLQHPDDYSRTTSPACVQG